MAVKKILTNIEYYGQVTNDKHPVTKEYVDQLVEGLSWSPVKAATTENLAGTMGPDFITLTATANGALPSIDGVTLAVGDRVLLWEQSDLTQNGLYAVTVLGDAETPWEMVRSGDADTGDEFRPNKTVYVLPGGTLHGDQSFKQVTATAVTLGSTPIEFAPNVDTGKVTSETYTITGDGSLSEFTIPHGFNTKNVIAMCSDSTGHEVVFDVQYTAANVVLSAATAIPTGDEYTVVIHGQAVEA